MFALNRTTRVFLKIGATDLRLGVDGLYGQVVSILKQDALSGHVFGFCNRVRTKVKLLTFDGSGLWVCAQRLEGGRFAWPQSGESEIDILALQAVLSGFELKARRYWYRRSLPGTRAPVPGTSSST
ncbi:MAG: IS66 family insertion sequence element accessory protein TnpB [Gallionella sp.]|jgi:transposase|nr:IS66 family insertion sequence element accessory protein TnpB [Gallionella sp.]